MAAERALALLRAYGAIRRRNIELAQANKDEHEAGDWSAEDEALDAIRDFADRLNAKEG